MFRYFVKMSWIGVDPAFVNLGNCLIEVVTAWTEREAMDKASLKSKNYYPVCAERDNAHYLMELARCIVL